MDVTDGFSPAGLTSLALTLQHRAFAAAEELAQHEDSRSQHLSNALSPIATQVEQFGQLVTNLYIALDSHPALTPRLQTCLNQYFSSCDPAMAAFTKELMRLQPSTLEDVDWHYLAGQQALLKAYCDLFTYLEEMLRVEDREGQDASLNASRGRFIVETTDREIQNATQTTSILRSGGLELPPEKDAPAYTPPEASKDPLAFDPDAPPPYEPPPSSEQSPPPISEKGPPPPMSPVRTTTSDSIHHTHTSPRDGQSASSSPAGPSRSSSSQAGPSQAGPSSSSSMTSFTSLSRSFKALTSSLRSKPDPLVSVLCQATTNGDVQQIAGLLKHGANISGRDENGDTPLHCAIRADQGPAATQLLNAGADVTGSGSGWSKMPPLFLAASLGSLDVARAILDTGARVDQRNTSGQPYFVDVVAGGNMAGIRFLLENGANANVSSISGRPNIVLAAKKNNLELLKLLVEFDAKVNVSDMTGNSLLAVAAEKGDLTMIDFLIEHGADPNSRTLNGVTVLIEAINKGKAELATKLLKSGADANSWDLVGQAAIVPALKDIKAPTVQKMELVRTLLERGADVHATTVGWSTPCVWLAVESGNLDMVQLLLRHGARTSATRQDVTLLVYAVDKDEMKLAKLLIKNGADPDLADKKGRTPLVMALVKQNVEMVKLLVTHGANTDVKDTTPPVELSKAFANPEIVAAMGITPPPATAAARPRRLSKH